MDSVSDISAEAHHHRDNSVGETDIVHSDSDRDAGDATGSSDNGRNERKILPPEISKSVMTLTCESSAEGGVCDVYLVGTAHVSKVLEFFSDGVVLEESCEEVQTVIDFLKPQVVFLELCSSRVAILTHRDIEVPTFTEMVEMWKKNHNLFGILYSWFLAKVASELEVLPGEEFRVAYEAAITYGGKVILGDRPVQITLRRTWAKMSLWHKTKLVYGLLFHAFFLPSSEELTKALKEMNDADMLTLLIQEMSKQFPTLMETLVHERDQYMSATILKTAREHNSVVAVIGKGHLLGIKKNWEQPVEVRELLTVPTQKSTGRIGNTLASIGIAATGIAIITGIYFSIKK